MKKLLSRVLSSSLAFVMLFSSVPAQAGTVISDYVTVPIKPAPEVTKITVTFEDVNPADTSVITTTPVEVEEGATLSPSDWAKPEYADGYRFDGWYADLDNDPTTEPEKVKVLTDLTDDITLTSEYVKQYTITYVNYDDEELNEVDVDEGSSFNAADYYNLNGDKTKLEQDGHGFTGWNPATIASVDADTTIQAQYVKVADYTFTINYVYEGEDGEEVANPCVLTYHDGYDLDYSVKSPGITGFAADKEKITFKGTVGDSVTVSWPAFATDESGNITETTETAEWTTETSKEITVTYKQAAPVSYSVEYYRQDPNEDGTGYVYNIIDDKTNMMAGNIGELTAITDAMITVNMPEEGFEPVSSDPAYYNSRIEGSGKTIAIYYNRKSNYVIFNSNGGDYKEPVYGLYEAEFELPTPVRTGYTFNGWKLGEDGDIIGTEKKETDAETGEQVSKYYYNFGAETINLYADWTVADTTYTVVVWREDADDNGTFTVSGGGSTGVTVEYVNHPTKYSVLGTLKFKGTAESVINYIPGTLTDIEGNNIETSLKNGSKTETASYFEFDTERSGAAPTIKGDGSTVYNVYYTRKTFTVKFYMGGKNSNKDIVLTLRNGDRYGISMGRGFASNPIYTLICKYDAYLQNYYPDNIWFDGMNVSYNGWVPVTGSGTAGGYATDVTSTRSRMDSNLCNASSTVQEYNLQTIGGDCTDDRNYVIESIDGTCYTDAGYNEKRQTNNPGQPMSGAIKNNKEIMGFTFKGRACIAVYNRIEGTTYTAGLTLAKPETETSTVFDKNTILEAVVGGAENGAVKRFGATDYGVGSTKDYITIWWYNRNKYKIELRQGGNVVGTVEGIPYEDDLSNYSDTVDNLWNAYDVPDGYTFAGWYTDVEFGSDTAVDFSTSETTMPAGNIVLYAKLQKESYTVNFYENEADKTDGKTPYKRETVEKEECVNSFAAPIAQGSRFEYWYYIDDNGVERTYTFDMQINRDMDLFAKWTGTGVGYTVKYRYNVNEPVYDADGNKIEDVTRSGNVKAKVTENAPAAYTANKESLFAFLAEQSLTLTGNAEDNVIIFEYVKDSRAYYQVVYKSYNKIGADGTLAEADLTDTEYGEIKLTNNAVVTVKAETKTGYTPTKYQQTVTMAAGSTDDNAGNNVIVFNYIKNPDGNYVVERYFQNDDGKTFPETAGDENTSTNPGTIGAPVTLDPNDDAQKVTGFTLNTALSTMSGTVRATNSNLGSLILKLYYNRNTVKYTYNCIYDDGEKDTVLRTTTQYGLYGTSKTLTVPGTIDTYELAEDQENTVVLDAENSVYNCTIVLKAEAEDNIYNFYYDKSYLALRYDANRGTGAPVDETQYKQGDSGDLAPQGEMQYSGYRFVGWSTTRSGILMSQSQVDAAVEAGLICTTFEFDTNEDKTYYAVWCNLSARLSYAFAVNDSGCTGTLPATKYCSLNTQDGGKTTIADGNGLTRTGYTFDGWMYTDAAGVKHTYKPGDPIDLADTGSVTLYAVWAPISYDIYYELTSDSENQGWSNPHAGTTTYTIESPSLSLRTASMTDCTFNGWYTDKAGRNPVTGFAITQGVTTGDQTFYAKFTKRPSTESRLSLDGFDVVYDGEEHSVTLNDPDGELLPTDTLEYDADTTYTDVTDGIKVVNLNVIRDGGTIAQLTATVNIVKRSVYIQMASGSFKYDGNDHTLAEPYYNEVNYVGTVLSTTNVAAGQTMNFTPLGITQRTPGIYLVTGSYEILDAQGRDVTHNYDVTVRPGTLTIESGEETVYDSEISYIYDGMAHTFVNPTMEANGEIVTGVSYEYSMDGVNFSAEMPEYIDVLHAADGTVDSYTLTVRLSHPDYDTHIATAKLTILPAPLNVSYGALSVDYDGMTHSVERTVTGMRDRDAIAMSDVNREAEDVTWLTDGTYGALSVTAADISITDAQDESIDRSGNYTVSVTDGSIEIRPLTLEVIANNSSYVYNASEQSADGYIMNGTAAAGQSVNVTMNGASAINVVNAQPVVISGVTVTDDANGADVTRNYIITTQNGALTITPAPLVLDVTTLTVQYDGNSHQPQGYVASGLCGTDRLNNYTLSNMPQRNAGVYANVSFNSNVTTLSNSRGEDVTSNYNITYRTGTLTIIQATANYSVEYYYDGVLGATTALTGAPGTTITSYPARQATGYQLSDVTGLPQTLQSGANNVIRVYYTTVQTQELTTITDGNIPLAGNMASLNVGAAVE